MSEDEKLREIEKHARAMYETWESWDEWTTNVGREIYAKTTKKRLKRNEYVSHVLSLLRDSAGAKFVENKMEGTTLVAEWDQRDMENVSANRGVWIFRETKNNITIISDNLCTIGAGTIEEYRMIQRRLEKKKNGISQEAEDVKSLMETIVSPEIVEQITRQVEKRFNVRIQLLKDRMVASFGTRGLRSHGKLYEIEKHVEALTEAWKAIKEKVEKRRWMDIYLFPYVQCRIILKLILVCSSNEQ
ncbi:MAG: hypothetical protein ACUVTL_01845 [Thermoproteota archaeon]